MVSLTAVGVAMQSGEATNVRRLFLWGTRWPRWWP